MLSVDSASTFCARAPFLPGVDLGGEALDDVGMVGGDVVEVERVVDVAVELELRVALGDIQVLDQLPSVQHHRQRLDVGQGGIRIAKPTVAPLGKRRTADPAEPVRRIGCRHQRNQALSLRLFGHREAGELEQRRHHVDRLHQLADHGTGRNDPGATRRTAAR